MRPLLTVEGLRLRTWQREIKAERQEAYHRSVRGAAVSETGGDDLPDLVKGQAVWADLRKHPARTRVGPGLRVGV